MKISCFVCLLALLTAPLCARAADSAANTEGNFNGVPGTPAYMSGDGRTEHPSVRLQSENIVVTLRPNELYETRAQFVFVNDSANAVTVKMGFPEFNNPARFPPETTGFKQFAATIRGKAVVAPRVEVPDRIDVISWRIATVKFAPRERVEVASMALSPVHQFGTFGSSRLLSYQFTGEGWKGKVGRTDVEVRVPMAGHWVGKFGVYDLDLDGEPRSAPATHSVNGVGYFRGSWRNWSGKASGQWTLQRVMPNWLIETGDELYFDYDAPFMRELQVGAGVGRLDNPAPQGYQKQGETLVSLDYLAQIAAASGEPNGLSWDAGARTATLQIGLLKAAFTPGQTQMKVQRAGASETVNLPITPEIIDIAGKGTLYVPLGAAAQALGLDYRVDADKHALTVELPQTVAPTPV